MEVEVDVCRRATQRASGCGRANLRAPFPFHQTTTFTPHHSFIVSYDVNVLAKAFDHSRVGI